MGLQFDMIHLAILINNLVQQWKNETLKMCNER